MEHRFTSNANGSSIEMVLLMDSLVEPRVVQQPVSVVEADLLDGQESDGLFGEIPDGGEIHADGVASPFHELVEEKAGGDADEELVLEDDPESFCVPFPGGDFEGLDLVPPKGLWKLVEIEDGEERDPEPETKLGDDEGAAEDDDGLGIGGEDMGPEGLAIEMEGAKEEGDEDRVEEDIADLEGGLVVGYGGAPFVVGGGRIGLVGGRHGRKRGSRGFVEKEERKKERRRRRSRRRRKKKKKVIVRLG